MRGSTSTTRAIVTPNIWGYLWGKEAYGAMLFATALTNESIADALAMPRYRELYIALAREILAVAQARGVTPEAIRRLRSRIVPAAAPAGAAERSLDELVAHNRKSAKTHSGIWRDLAVRKRRTEVDAQLGIVVTLGTQAGVADAAHGAARRADSRDRERRARAVARDARRARRNASRDAAPRMNIEFRRQDRNRHRRRARLRPRDQCGVRATRRDVSGPATFSKTSSRDAALCANRGGACVPRIVDVRDKMAVDASSRTT